jgi:O-acetyl-ADP-ribose deacetylase
MDPTTKIELWLGDITKFKADAIVNAANTSLLGGGGVDGAIHRAGGPEILAECRKIRDRQGGCKVGEAVITTAGKLPARYVIHTVGPVWNEGQGDPMKLLENAYANSLRLAAENGIQTIAFPSISTGIYRFPKDLAAEIAIRAVNSYLETHNSIEKVTFVCFDEANFAEYQKRLKP